MVIAKTYNPPASCLLHAEHAAPPLALAQQLPGPAPPAATLLCSQLVLLNWHHSKLLSCVQITCALRQKCCSTACRKETTSACESAAQMVVVKAQHRLQLKELFSQFKVTRASHSAYAMWCPDVTLLGSGLIGSK